jgi:dienelactone hydrolase
MNALKSLIVAGCFVLTALMVSAPAQDRWDMVPRRRVVLADDGSLPPSPWKGWDVEERAVGYREGTTDLEGWLAIPKNEVTRRAAVLIIHDWTGVQDYSKKRARQLAELGCVVLVADIYGKGIRPSNPKESGVEAGKYKTDRALFRARLLAGLAELKKQPNVDPDRIVAIGYCFGGTGVLELARAGADVKGVVSFHGGLDSPTPADGRNIKAKVLVLHGADDPYVPAEGITAMTAEFNAAKVDWQMISYSGAVHSFTNPGAGNDNSKGAAYNAAADARSWVAMRSFFDEIFAPAAK